MDDKQAFWDEQAQRGSLSGTRDRYAKELEMQAIARHVRDGMRVLDVGCGDGETMQYLSKQKSLEWIVGIDSSSEMLKTAYERKYQGRYSFSRRWIKDLMGLKGEYEIRPFLFDLIYTQRALINLDTWEEQRQAILDIISLLKPGGTYIMVECFAEGLDEINALRVSLGLQSIVPPWHNRYLKSNETEDFIINNCDWYPDMIYFSGAYYFMSRVVNAWIANRTGMEPKHGAPVNYLGTLLPSDCVNLRGQTQAWIIKKKEG